MAKETAEEFRFENQTLIDHLGELRIRIVRSLYAILIAAAVCYYYSEQLFDIIRAPIQTYLPNGGLVFTAPTDKFMAHLKVAFFSGVLVSCPVWFYQLWKFVAPGLYANERKYSFIFIASGSLLFVIGVLFAYYGVMPVAFQYLMNFGGSIDKPMITIDSYLGTFLTMALMFGLTFELPVVLVILGMMGIVSKKFLTEKRRYAVVLLAIMSAIFTPGPDILSQMMMLVPMVILYELAVVIVGFVEKRRAIAVNERE